MEVLDLVLEHKIFYLLSLDWIFIRNFLIFNLKNFGLESNLGSDHVMILIYLLIIEDLANFMFHMELHHLMESEDHNPKVLREGRPRMIL